MWASCAFALGGCAFGPRAMELSHCRYNEALKQVEEEQLLLNLVRMRYNDDFVKLDISSIAAQYELDGTVGVQPFFTAQGANIGPPFGPFRSFTSILPLASATGANRPTISMTPMNGPDNLRPLFTPSTLDGLIFLSETSWPVSTVFRLWVEYLNHVPNAVTTSGPPRALAPEFLEFQRAMQLLQSLQDSGDLRFAREEKIKEMGSPLPAAAVTAAALVAAAKDGYEYQRKPDNTWVLIKRNRRLELRINPARAGDPEVMELFDLLHLKPGLLRYEIAVGSARDTFPKESAPEANTALNVTPRSTIQALYYMSHGVEVPSEHVACGIAVPPVGDWQDVTRDLFTVRSVKQRRRPEQAHVAVKYRGYWFYIDDRDNDSKMAFGLMMTMTRLNLLGTRKGGPLLTLPVGPR
jgi:hypothetical protein